MPRTIISEGKTSTEAIEKGLKELRLTRNQVEIKILEEKKKSFFNILDPHIVKVEITEKEGVKESQERRPRKEKKRPINKQKAKKAEEIIGNFLKEFLSKVSENIEYKIEETPEYIEVVVTGKGAEKLIGYRGESLNALQTILTAIINKENNSDVKVILDIENYKNARKKTLEELSEKIEKTVTKTGKTITLEPMTAYERKIIHTKLQDSRTVKTYSIGENDRRRVVIAKK